MGFAENLGRCRFWTLLFSGPSRTARTCEVAIDFDNTKMYLFSEKDFGYIYLESLKDTSTRDTVYLSQCSVII